MRLEGTVAIICAALFLTAGAARGQFSQYTQPGTAAPGGARVTRETMAEAVSDARWQVGGLRLDPWLALRDVSWHDNPGGQPEGSGEPESDVAAVGGAGLRAYLPTGPDVTWVAYALPEYLWWDKQTDRRRLNGRYGAGAFAFFNRLTLEATGSRTERLSIVSSELPEQVNNRETSASVATSLRLGFSTAVFVEGAESQVRNLIDKDERAAGPDPVDPLDPLNLLDRDERRLRTGLSYEPRSRWRLQLGYEWTETDSLDDARNLSSKGTAPLVTIAYDGPKVDLSVEVQELSLEAEPGSELADTDVTTYSATLGADGNRLSASVYARRTLSLALADDFSHFETDLVGLTAGLHLGRRTDLTAFAETGQADFRSVAAALPGTPERQDDITAYGAELTMTLGSSVNLHLGGSQTEFDSNLPGQDRSLTVLSAGVSFGIGGEDPWTG